MSCYNRLKFLPFLSSRLGTSVRYTNPALCLGKRRIGVMPNNMAKSCRNASYPKELQVKDAHDTYKVHTTVILCHQSRLGSKAYVSRRFPTASLQSANSLSRPVRSKLYLGHYRPVDIVLLHSSSPRLAAPFFLAPILAFLKSGSVIKAITLVSRVAVSLVAPLRLGARRILTWWHGHEHIAELKAQAKASAELTGDTSIAHYWHRPHFQRTTVILLAAPVVLVAIALLASLERTPIWGRWRVIMMSTDEEALLIDQFLAPGTPQGAHVDAPVKRDWIAILRNASEEGEEASSPPGTINGWRVLDPAYDWRARWVQDVFNKLEAGIGRANLTADCKEDRVFEIDGHKFSLPTVDYPLTVRPAMLKHHGHSEDEPAEGPLVTHYGCLVVDSPSRNAFSLGFGPALDTGANKNQEAPGVVVVFTGLLDEILAIPGREPRPTVDSATPSVFGVLQRPREFSVSAGATKYHTDQLAVALSHEVGHLLLSHSLEAWASNDMYEILGTLATDLARIILYPLTAFLGPVFNDWFGEQIKVNSALGLTLKSCCEQRKAEHEADLIGLRVLLGAGMNPYVALDFWKEDGIMHRIANSDTAFSAIAPKTKPKNKEDEESWLERNGFTRSHPMNEDRLNKIKAEIGRWEVR